MGIDAALMMLLRWFGSVALIILALAVVTLLLWPQALPAPATHFRDARRIATRHPSGLGSRGPPLHG